MNDMYSTPLTMEDRIAALEARILFLEQVTKSAVAPVFEVDVARELRPGVKMTGNGKYLEDGKFIKKEDAYL